MKNTAAIALLVARAAAQRADMNQDRAVPAAVLKATTAEDTCTDATVSAATNTLTTAQGEYSTQKTALGLKTTAVNDALTAQTTAVKAVTDDDTLAANVTLVTNDVNAAKSYLENKRLTNIAEHAKQDKAALLAKETLAKTASLNLKTTANTLRDNASTADSKAISHYNLEVTLSATKLAAMNAAMATWKGRVNTGSDLAAQNATEDLGKAAAAYVSGSKAKLEETALTNLTTAVGACTMAPVNSVAVAWTGGACTGTSAIQLTGLVKFALRKKLGVDAIATAAAQRETYLDAYCRASQTLGTSTTDLAAGKEYYSRANPGKRLDFDFSATITISAYLTAWTWETLGDPIAPVTSNAQTALNNVFKCQAATDTDNTGNTGRIYGTTSGILSTSIATQPIGALAALVTAGDTAKAVASTGMEAKFTTWKTAAAAAMTGYKAMIDGDTAFALVGNAVNGCKVTGSNNCVVTLWSAAQEALVAAGTEATMARPSNLVTATFTETNEGTVKTSCEDKCKLLPSWGLSLTGAGAAALPTVVKEVCQGVETANGGTATATAWKAACKFVSSAKANLTTATDYILLDDTGAAVATRCQKRDNQKGLLWRALVVNAAAWTTGDYPTVHASYTGFTTALGTWITARGLVIASYQSYLLLKTTCQKIGKSYLDEIVKVTSANARVTGTKGTDITNMNLSDAYEAEWVKVYGDTPAVLASLDVAKPYDSLKPTNLSVTGTGTYALWLQAKAATAVASTAHATAKTAWGLQKDAVIAQGAIKALAATEKGATNTASGNADSAYNLINVATTGTFAVATLAASGAVTAYNNAKGLYDTAEGAYGTTTGLAATFIGAIAAKRTTADAKVVLTTTAIGEQTTARQLLATKMTAQKAAQKALNEALVVCKNTKYDAYRQALSTAAATRETNLATIKTLLETNDAAKKAAGSTGARCEKAMSQGNGRSARVKPCTSETDCCGAAKGTVVATTVWATAPLMTIETCQPVATKKYSYYPPRAPMATVDPTSVAADKREWDFACIAGASNLAAAATALATAAYMMA